MGDVNQPHFPAFSVYWRPKPASMQRRQFGKKLATVGLGTSLIATSNLNAISKRPDLLPKKRKAKRLKSGDTVGMITPGSYISDDSLEQAVSNLESLGFQV